jgi:hypothetical protein
MTRPMRATAVGVVFAVFVAGVTMLFLYFLHYPPTVAAAATTGSNGQEEIHLQTVPALGTGPHPTYVSYLADINGKWVHTTMFELKANTLVHFTIDQYDTGSTLRNSFMDQVQGTVGSTEVLNGGSPVRLINDNTDNGIGHTFAVPTLGISVPMPGIPSADTNVCSVAPCAASFDHNVVQFTIKTPATGLYPWQCFVPCGLGWPYGNGGGMSTLGYMSGFLKVVA